MYTDPISRPATGSERAINGMKASIDAGKTTSDMNIDKITDQQHEFNRGMGGEKGVEELFGRPDSFGMSADGEYGEVPGEYKELYKDPAVGATEELGGAGVENRNI